MPTVNRTSGLPREVAQLQDALVQPMQWILGKEILDGQLLESVELTGGSVNNDVPHKLGRRLTGWILVRKRSASDDIYDNQDDLTADQKKLYLRLLSISDCTVDLWVF